mgnify:CR=1 FL=1
MCDGKADCTDGSDEAYCLNRCCTHLTVNNAEFFIQTDPHNNRPSWKSTDIDSELRWNSNGYWQISTKDGKTYAFSKSDSICPISDHSWSVWVIREWQPMSVPYCKATKIIGVLVIADDHFINRNSQLFHQFDESIENINYIIGNINATPQVTPSRSVAKDLVLGTMEVSSCFAPLEKILEQILLILQNVEENHGNCKIFSFLPADIISYNSFEEQSLSDSVSNMLRIKNCILIDSTIDTCIKRVRRSSRVPFHANLLYSNFYFNDSSYNFNKIIEYEDEYEYKDEIEEPIEENLTEENEMLQTKSFRELAHRYQ